MSHIPVVRVAEVRCNGPSLDDRALLHEPQILVRKLIVLEEELRIRVRAPREPARMCAIEYNSPIWSYRYTVAMFPLPYKNVLRYRAQQNAGGISILASNTKCTRECRPHFAACGTPDRAIPNNAY
jgi:hypothetical protein